MSLIRSLLILLSGILFLLTGNSNEKDILRKKPTKEDHIRTIECWIERHFTVLCFIAIVLVLIAFMFVCFTVCGVSATESGVQYNHFQEVI